MNNASIRNTVRSLEIVLAYTGGVNRPFQTANQRIMCVFYLYIFYAALKLADRAAARSPRRKHHQNLEKIAETV